MYYERLSLEIIAAKLHWGIVSPPTLVGRSGITHRFDFVVVDGHGPLAFDIFDRMSETDVIRTFVKKLDTGASAYIICHTEKMSEGAGKLAAEYGLKVLHSDDIESAFRKKVIERRPRGRKPTAA